MFVTMLASGLWGCGAEPAPRRIETDSRDQYALLHEIEAAREVKNIAAYRKVRDDWAGRRLRWDALRVSELCTSGGCYVIPFDSARYPGIVREGWLPHLAVDPTQVHEACARAGVDRHTGCVVTFEGTLSTFRFTPEELTRLAFDDVALVGARAVQPTESWGQRHVPGRGDLDAVRRRGEELRAQGYTSTLSVRTSP